jgi:anti-anti-sigma regulatory factor
LIVNCDGVLRVEAMGLGVLVERLCRARDLGGTLALVNVGPELSGRMRELRVDSLFPTFGSVQAALDGLIGDHPDAAAALAA